MNQTALSNVEVHRRLAFWYFAYFAFVGAYMPYFSLYLESLDLSPQRIALLMTLGQLMRLLTPMAWGWASDRSGRRTPIIRLSAAMSCLIFFGYYFTKDFFFLIAVTGALHFFWCASLPLVEALTFGHLRSNPAGYGRVRVWGSVGFVVSVFAVGLWLDKQPIDSLLGISLVLLICTLIGAWKLIEVPGDVLPLLSQPSLPSLRQSKVIALMVVGFLMSAAHGAFYVFYSIHLTGYGYSTTAIGLLWSLGVVAEILVFTFVPKLTEQSTLKWILIACLALAVLRFLAIGWMAEFLIVLIVTQILHAATFGAHHIASVAALNHWFLPQQQGRVQALYGSLSFGGGGMLGGLLAGQTWGSWGAGQTFTISAGFAAIGLVVVHFAFATKEPQRQALPSG
jgi:MFS transporter, PPP family, 3-phenylpropionic acid transporter